MNSIPAQDIKRRGIVAKDIERWAQGSAARGDLPGLIRRLAVLAASVTEIAFPAGDSVTRPGWDGRILSQVGDPWVPAGLSLWELSVESKVTTKANSDYEKRTQETDLDTRKESTLVIVTARHWAKKEDWVSKKRAQGEWQSVRAYDARARRAASGIRGIQWRTHGRGERLALTSRSPSTAWYAGPWRDRCGCLHRFCRSGA